MELVLTPAASVIDWQQREARRKAEELVAMVQASSGLEGQAIDDEVYRQLVRESTQRLIAGSKRDLWA
jgi:hypothetical protein